MGWLILELYYLDLMECDRGFLFGNRPNIHNLRYNSCSVSNTTPLLILNALEDKKRCFSSCVEEAHMLMELTAGSGQGCIEIFKIPDL